MNTEFQITLSEQIDMAAEEVLCTFNSKIEWHKGSINIDTISRSIKKTHALGIRSRSHLDEKTFELFDNLLVIGCYCIGTNQVDLKLATERGIPVFNSPYSNTRSVAELTIAEIIALHRKLGDRNQELHAGNWVKTSKESYEIRNRVLGIVGYGHIGSQLSILAESLGMKVLYFDIESKMSLGNASPTRSLEELLQKSDVISIHTPANNDTKNMFNEKNIFKMKKGSFLINNARGSIVDLKALATAINIGHIKGAAIDVHPCEPATNSEKFFTPLAGIKNVILTPHIGGSTHEAQASIARDVSKKISNFLLNGTTIGAVNLPGVQLPEARIGHERILHFHQNVPGVLGRLHSKLADLGTNIHSEYLQSLSDLSYVILDVDPVDKVPLRELLTSIPETIAYRIISDKLITNTNIKP